MAAIGSALRVARSSMAKGERQVVSGHSSPGDRELAHNEAASPDVRDFCQPRIAQRGGRAGTSECVVGRTPWNAVSGGLRR